MNHPLLRRTLVPGLLLALLALPGVSPGQAPARLSAGEPTGRFIVKFRGTDDEGRRRALAAPPAEGPGRQRAQQLASRLGMPVRASREITPDLVTVIGTEGMDAGEQAAWLERLAADPEVEFVVPDERRRAHSLPADPLYAQQWYLQAVEAAAGRHEIAWDTTGGAPDTVIAVLDTGIRFEHPDLGRVGEGGRMLPGYDFVSADGGGTFRVANDGDGRDPDPSDPGDWVSQADTATNTFRTCEVSNSSWHGTRVAGMIAAITNNGVGLAGGTWEGALLPVRVLGKCGGFDSDIIAGMRWAGGLPVSGVPANPNPAKVLNMSLGGSGTCTSAYQNAVSDLTAAGVLVVASAGNDNGPVDVPGNCPGVMTVAGLRHIGTKVGYSSQGAPVGIAAPAGNCVNEFGPCLFSLMTTTNLGTSTPGASGYTDLTQRINLGTSFAAPIVAAIAGLMHGVNANLNTADLRNRLKASARPFPIDPSIPTCPATDPATGQCNCTTTTCGAGIADAPQAVEQALRPIARIATPPSTAPGATVPLDGTGSRSARLRNITAWNWTLDTAPAGTAITNPASPTATIVAPTTGAAVVRLTVTDDAGRSDSTTLTVGGTVTTGGGSSSGGGGGTSDWLVAGVLLVLLRGRRRRPH